VEINREISKMKLYKTGLIVTFVLIAIGSIIADYVAKEAGVVLIVMGFLVMPSIVFVLYKLGNKQS